MHEIILTDICLAVHPNHCLDFHLVIMVGILEKGITLNHPYSRNKSDYTDLIYFSCCFYNRLVREIIVK